MKAQLARHKMMQLPQREGLLLTEPQQRRAEIRLVSNAGAGKDQESVCSDREA